MKRKDLVGDLINFRGIVYAPLNEQGVVFLFGKIIEDLHMYIELIRTGYPDCIGRRFVGDGWEKVNIEFEYKSKNFLVHKHDPKKCDIVVCWEHDWDECPIEVIELKEIIKGLPQRPIKRPTDEKEQAFTLQQHFSLRSSTDKTEKLYDKLDMEIKKIDPNIWRNVAKTAITYYSPERVFSYIKVQQAQIKIHCFTGANKMQRVDNPWSDAPKWGRCYLKEEQDVQNIIKILEESLKRVNQALKENENTGWFAELDMEENDEVDLEFDQK